MGTSGIGLGSWKKVWCDASGDGGGKSSREMSFSVTSCNGDVSEPALSEEAFGVSEVGWTERDAEETADDDATEGVRLVVDPEGVAEECESGCASAVPANRSVRSQKQSTTKRRILT